MGMVRGAGRGGRAVVEQGDAAELDQASVIPPSTCAALQVLRTHARRAWRLPGGPNSSVKLACRAAPGGPECPARRGGAHVTDAVERT